MCIIDSLTKSPISVLDDGFVRVVDIMGNDSSIVQAARVSYGTGTKKVNEDCGLIRYLMRKNHTSPFDQKKSREAQEFFQKLKKLAIDFSAT